MRYGAPKGRLRDYPGDRSWHVVAIQKPHVTAGLCQFADHLYGCLLYTSPANLYSPGNGSTAKSPNHDYALALLQWERGAQAGPQDYHHYWVAAAADLNEGVVAHVPGTSGYPRVASELLKLVHLPFVVNTPVQMQAGAAALFEALNSFFSTDGLYDCLLYTSRCV